MAKKPSVTTLASGFNSTEALNNNFTNIRDQFDNTLSLDGSVPNAMEADLDINNNDLLNVNSATITTLTNTTLTGDSASFNSLTVDGANINAFTAAYKLKLDNIEDNATADQTASEIEALVSHDNLQDFVANEHIDWTTDQGSTNIHAGNYTDTTYSIGNGGLTEVNFTAALNTKLTNIEDNATADQTASEILTAVKTVDGATSGLDADLLDGQHGSYYTGYADTAVSNLVDSAPSTLDTLNELAAALGDDANFSTTVTNSIATKMPLAGGTFTGNTSYGDNDKIIMGDGTDLQIYSDTTAGILKGDDVRVYTASGGSVATFNDAVQLYHNGSLTLQTANTGVDVTGNIVVSGTVDGVDIAARDAVLTSTTTTANAAMPTSGGTFTGDVTILNTDGGSGRAPDFNLKRDSASPAAWDYLGAVRFLGEDGGSNETPYASILGRIVDPTSGSEDGRLEIWQQKAGTGTLTYVFDHDAFKLMNEQPIKWQDHHGTAYDVLVEPATPTADRTITLPDRTGEVVVSNGAVGTDATALIGRGKIGYCGFSDVISISHEDYGTSNAMGFGQNVNGHTWLNSPSGASPTLRVENNIVLDAKATEIVAHQDIKLDTNKNLVFEGATSNDYETTLTVTDPTADQTITLPNQTGTAMLWQSAWPDDTGTARNYAIGYEALNNLASGGEDNVAYGYQALQGNTTGGTNVAIGSYALYQNTTGTHNTAVGFATGYSFGGVISSGTYIGSNAGNYNWQGKDYQTAVGAFAMNDQSADYTTAVGYNAMSDGDHYRSTAVGYNALARSSTGSPYYNTAVGQSSGNSLWSGDGNTLVGHDTDTYNWYNSYGVSVGYQPRVGTYGVSIGNRAAYSLYNDSDYCVTIGNEAGYDLDGGDYCVFIGSQAGYSGGTGNDNTTVGANGLRSLTDGVNNSSLGSYSLYSVTSGDYNTAIGSYAGYSLSTGGSNTFLGYAAGQNQDNSTTNALTTGSNVTCVGFQAIPSSQTATNEITLGDNDITSLRCNVQTISSLSDERDKTAIADLTYGLDFINDMRPVEFTWNRRDGSMGAKPDMGFIAQDLYETELNHSSSSRTRLVNWDNPEKLEADYVRSYPILVKAVQELSAQVTALQARIETLEGN